MFIDRATWSIMILIVTYSQFFLDGGYENTSVKSYHLHFIPKVVLYIIIKWNLVSGCGRGGKALPMALFETEFFNAMKTLKNCTPD